MKKVIVSFTFLMVLCIACIGFSSCGNTPSDGLVFELNENSGEYQVTGIGTCMDSDVVIPKTYNGVPVTGIAKKAFYQCKRLTSITIPDSVTSIGYDAFKGCTGLTSIMIPDSVTSIGSMAFGGCQNLESITIPNSVTLISSRVFWECDSLKSVKIPESVKTIAEYAFEGCESLTSITIPDGVTGIGQDVFSRCSNLTIYCEAESKPDKWHARWNVHTIDDDWNFSYCPVVWGYED